MGNKHHRPSLGKRVKLGSLPARPLRSDGDLAPIQLELKVGKANQSRANQQRALILGHLWCSQGVKAGPFAAVMMGLWLQVGRIHASSQRPVTAVGGKPSTLQDHEPDPVHLHKAVHGCSGRQTPGCVKSGHGLLIRARLLRQLVLSMEGIDSKLAVKKVCLRL